MCTKWFFSCSIIFYKVFYFFFLFNENYVQLILKWKDKSYILQRLRNCLLSIFKTKRLQFSFSFFVEKKNCNKKKIVQIIKKFDFFFYWIFFYIGNFVILWRFLSFFSLMWFGDGWTVCCKCVMVPFYFLLLITAKYFHVEILGSISNNSNKSILLMDFLFLLL